MCEKLPARARLSRVLTTPSTHRRLNRARFRTLSRSRSSSSLGHEKVACTRRTRWNTDTYSIFPFELPVRERSVPDKPAPSSTTRLPCCSSWWLKASPRSRGTSRASRTRSTMSWIPAHLDRGACAGTKRSALQKSRRWSRCTTGGPEPLRLPRTSERTPRFDASSVASRTAHRDTPACGLMLAAAPLWLRAPLHDPPRSAVSIRGRQCCRGVDPTRCGPTRSTVAERASGPRRRYTHMHPSCVPLRPIWGRAGEG